MNFAHWLKATITIGKPSSINAYGKPTHTQVTAKARVESQRRKVQTLSGDEAVATTRIYTDTEVLPGDRVWLPGADTSSVNNSRLVLAVSNADAQSDGYTLYEVDL